ncbi:hypothetical protein AA11825_2734 [Acetobacter pomorum DSM 11825]|nr:hypothetical protein AA11825_2734 [Acetobacter pomorum DSM 11825]
MPLSQRRINEVRSTNSLATDTLNTTKPLWILGGDGRVRTDDPLLAKQVLSQLSYAPIGTGSLKWWWAREDLNLRPHAYQACALTN